MPENPQDMLGRLLQGTFQESESDRLNKIRSQKDYERWAERQSTERAKDEYLMEQEYLKFLQKQRIGEEAGRDIRDYSTRPSAREFAEPSRGGPSSYMRSVGKLSEMLSEVMEMSGPGRFLKALKGAFAGRKVPKLKGRTRQETADQAREWINWFNKGRK